MNKQAALLAGVILLLIAVLILLASYGSRFARMERALKAHAVRINAPTSVTLFPSPSDMAGDGPFRREKWFKLTWLERRLYAWEKRQSDRSAVVFAGDSITQGWLNLERAFPGFRTANRGITGDTSRGVLYRLKDDVLEIEPRAIILLCGINDLSDGATPECVEQNIRAMIKLCKEANPKTPFIICTVLPVGPSNETLNIKLRALNTLLSRLAGEQANVWVADTWAALADPNGVARANEFPDALHPNEAGYARLEAFLRPLVEQIVSSRD